MVAKSTLPLAALCCALALTCPQTANAQAPGGALAAMTPLAAALPSLRGMRVTCTGCLSRPSSANAVVVDTARVDKGGKAPATGSATLRLPGFATDAKGRGIDLELRLDAVPSGLGDGDAIIDFAAPGATRILLGNPGSAEDATFTVAVRLLEAGTDRTARSGPTPIVTPVATSAAERDIENLADRTGPGAGGSMTVEWSGGDMFAVGVGAGDVGDAFDRDEASTSPDEAEDNGAQKEDVSPDEADDTQGEDVADGTEDGIPGESGPHADAAATDPKSTPGTPDAPEDPGAVDAGTLRTDRDCCRALVALDAPRELAAEDYPVTSASSRKFAMISLPKQFPLTYLPSGEVVAPTLLRLMGATGGWMDIKDIDVRNRATDAKIHLLARNADGSFEEWYDGDTYLAGKRRLELGSDVDFAVTLEGFSRETDGDLIEASVGSAQTLFTLAFTYDPVIPTV